MNIATQLNRLLKVSCRLKNIATFYLQYLIQTDARRTLRGASDLSGLNASQFSHFLADHQPLALENLKHQNKKRIQECLKKRKPFLKDLLWTVAIIIDATLHERSSRNLDNAQRFNHGDGWVIGHQWTNIVLLINGERIPLPPIPFLTQAKCKELGLDYKTEHEQIIDFLSSLNLDELLPGVKSEEIFFLVDSGYDNKKFQNFILSKGWGLIGRLKKSRSIRVGNQEFENVVEVFQKKIKDLCKLFVLAQIVGKSENKKHEL